MKTILKTDAHGALLLPPDLLPHPAPHRQYQVEADPNRVVVSDSETPAAFWQTAAPEERAADILRWAARHQDSPNLPDSAVGRDAIYD